MPYSTTTIGWDNFSTNKLVDWFGEACDIVWGDEGLSNAPENTSGGMRWWNDDIDRVVYEWAATVNAKPANDKDCSDDVEREVEMNEDDLMELLEMQGGE